MKAGGEAKRRELLKQLEDLCITDKTKLKISEEEEYKAKYGDIG